ncbi:MAG: pantetheine-phosphate adenylyltransferase [Bacilli bacterium]|nr:pantetheine-phosphate adenylyltransferase [Bacilli bacterium]
MKIAVYPGSFDPITNGHLDILRRSLKIFDKVIILLAVNPKKKSRFNVEERLEMMRGAVKDFSNVEVDFYAGLTVEYAKKVGAKALIRGLRAVTDFEYEFELSAGNSYIDSSIEMVFFMAGKEMSFISSSMVNELEESGVDVSKLVPPSVVEAYKKVK